MSSHPPQRYSPRGRSPDWVRAAAWVGAFVAVLWLLEGIDALVLGGSLDDGGVRPRSDDGLLGVLFAPLLHAGFPHLIANTVPVLVLGYLVLATGIGRGLAATAMIWAVSGLGVWVFSPTFSVTVGASGLIFGWLVYLLMRGFFTRSAWEVFVGIVVFLLYGSALLGVLPGQPGISWQAHLFGALGGALAAVLISERSRPRSASPSFD